MAQGSEFPLKKPPGFHYDFFLLGITTLIAGLLGLPAPNGLIPQAPIHTASLVVWGHPMNNKRDEENDVEEKSRKGDDSRDSQEVPVSVVEQRVSNLAQGALCLVLLTGPFLHILSLIPRGVLAGLLYVDRFRSGRIQLTPVSWYMGLDALKSNGITTKICHLIRDHNMVASKDPFQTVRYSRVFLFVAVQLLGFGVTMAITQTIGMLSFPAHLLPIEVIH